MTSAIMRQHYTNVLLQLSMLLTLIASNYRDSFSFCGPIIRQYETIYNTGPIF